MNPWVLRPWLAMPVTKTIFGVLSMFVPPSSSIGVPCRNLWYLLCTLWTVRWNDGLDKSYGEGGHFGSSFAWCYTDALRE